MIFSGFGPWASYVPAWTKNQLLLHKKFFVCCMRVSCAWIIWMICSLQTICAHHISAQTLSDISISLSLKDESLDQAFKKIEQLTPFRFAYRKNDTKEIQHLTLDVRLKKVNEVLDLLLQGSPLTYEQNDYTVFVTSKATVEQLIQKGSTTDTAIVVRGKVLSQDGSPLAGAVITVKGTKFGTASSVNGNFEIKDVPLNATLAVTFVGYQTYEAAITGASSYVLIKMQPSEVLDEVTVVSTGYQKLPKERSTGSFSVITAKELENIPTANLIQRIEGLVTGLQPKIMAGDNSFLYQGLTQGIRSTTRTVGTNDYDVNVRGNTTLLGEKMPLMVVDGFPTEFDIKSLNPSDIEQITVLKDAAAASIWGARAANGVIVIDTKKGRTRQLPTINLGTSYTAYSSPRFNYLPLANSAQIINYEEELINKGLNLYNPLTSAPAYQYYKSDASDLVYKVKAGLIDSATFNAGIAKLSAINGYDQYKHYLLQNANAQTYNLSVSGGNDVHTYFFSGSYTREVPSAKGTYGDRFTLTSNQSFKLFKIATLDFSLKAALFNYTYDGIGLSKLSNGTTTYLPYNQIVDENGNKVYYSYTYYKGRTDTLQSLRGYQNWGYNYLDELHATDRTTKDQNYSGIINLNVPIYKGLSVSGQFMIEKYYQSARNWYSPNSYYTRDMINGATSVDYSTGNLTYGIPLGGILYQSNSSNTNYSARAQAVYNASIGSMHRLNAVAGAEIRQTNQSQTGSQPIYGYNMQTGIGQPMLTNYIDVNGYTQTTYGINSTTQDDKTRRFLSYYTNAAYTLLNKYSLSGSVRYDDYNNFGVDRKYRATPLWSAGVKWNITGEDFLKKYSFINNLALRATYGYNGNIALGVYPFTNISLGSNYLTGQPSASVTLAANPTLHWEKTGMLNMGLDYSLFNNRVLGSVEYYTKRGKDLLWTFPIDPTYGIYTNSSASLLTNNTRVNAKGYEVTVTGVMIRQKNMNWAATFNFSYSQNKIADTRFVPTSSTYSSLSGTNISGYPTSALWAYRFAGLDKNGMTQIYGADKSTKLAPSQSPTSLDALYYAGNTTAPYYGSLSQTFRYKQFTLFAMGTYSFGSVFRRPTVSTYTSARYPSVQYDMNKDIDKRWRKPGDEATTNVPGIAGSYAPLSLFRYDFSDINILSGSYIRLREVSLGYDLPALIASKITAKHINFTLTVRNPGLIWTKNKEHIDPDFIPYLTGNTLTLPPSASFNMALNMTF